MFEDWDGNNNNYVSDLHFVPSPIHLPGAPSYIDDTLTRFADRLNTSSLGIQDAFETLIDLSVAVLSFGEVAQHIVAAYPKLLNTVLTLCTSTSSAIAFAACRVIQALCDKNFVVCGVVLRADAAEPPSTTPLFGCGIAHFAVRLFAAHVHASFMHGHDNGPCTGCCNVDDQRAFSYLHTLRERLPSDDFMLSLYAKAVTTVCATSSISHCGALATAVASLNVLTALFQNIPSLCHGVVQFAGDVCSAIAAHASSDLKLVQTAAVTLMTALVGNSCASALALLMHRHSTVAAFDGVLSSLLHVLRYSDSLSNKGRVCALLRMAMAQDKSAQLSCFASAPDLTRVLIDVATASLGAVRAHALVAYTALVTKHRDAQNSARTYGCVAWLVNVLSTLLVDDNDNVREFVVSALYYTCTGNTDNQTAAAELGVLEQALAVLGRRSQLTPKLKDKATKLLLCLISDHPSNQLRLASLPGGVLFYLRLIKHGPVQVQTFVRSLVVKHPHLKQALAFAFHAHTYEVKPLCASV